MSDETKCTANLPHVRIATPDDLNELLDMGRSLHRENGLLNLAEDIIKQEAMRAISGKGAIFGVIGGPNCIEAMIMLSLERYWYTRDLHLEEMLSYVRPEFRRSRNARALIEFAKRCAVALKVPLVIGLLSNQRTEQKISLYERAIGNKAGVYFLYNAKTGVQ